MMIIVQPLYAESRCALSVSLADDYHHVVDGRCAAYNVESIQPYLKDQELSVKKAEKIVRQYKMKGQERSSSHGIVTFSGLKAGTYLIVQLSASKGYYPFKSFLVKLPHYEKDTGVYRYNVKCLPKVEKKKTVAETPQLPVYETKETRETKKKNKPVAVKKTEQSASIVKTGDETILSVLVGMMLITTVTMIAAKKMK